MDNCYSEVRPFAALSLRGMYAVSTIQNNGKHFPRDILSNSEIKTMKRGDIVFHRFCNLLCVIWKDTRDVRLLSTMHPATGDRKGQRLTKENGTPIVLQVPVPPAVCRLLERHVWS